ncbi:MAG: YegP family protein [Sedimentibacter sp.]
MASKFVIKETKTGIKFDLKASNGQVIATSEVYSSISACKKGIESVKTNALVAETEDQTIEEYEVKKNPKFEMYTDKSENTRFRLKARNGQIIATSEEYKSKASCINGIESVVKNAPEAVVVEEK